MPIVLTFLEDNKLTDHSSHFLLSPSSILRFVHLPTSISPMSKESTRERINVVTTKLKRTVSSSIKRGAERLKEVFPETEGWMELFLTPTEKHQFAQWEEVLINKSLSNKLTDDALTKIARFIPDTVSPNMISLFGLASLGQGFYVANLYGNSHPTTTTWFAVVNIAIFY